MGTVEQRLVFVISARDDNVAKVTKAVQKALQGAAEASESSGTKMKKALGEAGREISAAAAGIRSSVLNIKTAVAGIVGASGLGLAAKKALEFGKGMSEISTIVDDVAESIPALSENIREVSREFGQTQGAAVKAQYDIISAGFSDAAEAAGVLRTSARLAVAGVSDIATAADINTTILNGFGLAAEDAEHAADLLFLTVRRGKTTLPELASSLGEIGPGARLAGVSLEEVGASMATLTAGGLRTSEAVTALNRLFAGMAAPTGEAASALREAGIELTKVGDDGRESVLPLLDIIRQFQGLDLKTIQSFFPNVRSVKALGLLSENFETFTDNFTEFTSEAATAGTLEEAFQRASSSAGFAISQLKSTVSDLLIEVGQGFTDELAGGAEEARQRLEDLKDEASDFGKAVGNALKRGLDFLREWHKELLVLVAAFLAVRAAMFTVAAIQTISTIATVIKRAAVATRNWAVEMRAAGAATSLATGGVLALVAAVGFLVAQPLGEWLGDAIVGAEDIEAALSKLTEQTRFAAEALENEFAKAVGTSREEARRLNDEGVSVLVETLEVYDRATGDAVDSAEALAAANANIGAGTRVVSAELIDVESAARGAAAGFFDAEDGVRAVSTAQTDLAAQVGVSAQVIARLPEEVQGAFADASKEIRAAKSDLEDFQEESLQLVDDLAVARLQNDDAGVEAIQSRLRFLTGAVSSEEARIGRAETRLEGLSGTVLEGVEAEAKARSDAAEEQEQADRQLEIRGLAAAKKLRKEAERDAKKLSAARAKALGEFAAAVETESRLAAAGLQERLDAVKAFAADSLAAQARAAVGATVTLEVSDAAAEQVEEALEEVTDAVEDQLGSLSSRVADAMEEGVGFADLAPDVGEALRAAADQMSVLSDAARSEADAAKADLLSITDVMAQGLIDAGTLTAEQVGLVLEDPLNSAAWAESAESAGMSISDTVDAMSGLAATVLDVRARTAEVESTFVSMSAAVEGEAAAAVRDFTAGLSGLTAEELRLVEATLDADDALTRSALRLARFRAETAEAAEAQSRLEKRVRQLSKELSRQDFGSRGVVDFIRNSKGLSDVLEDNADDLIQMALSAEDTEAAMASLGQLMDGLGAQASDAGLLELLKLKKEAQEFADDLEAAGLDPSSAEALGDVVGDEIKDRMLLAAAAVGEVVGSALRAAASFVLDSVRSLIQLASDPEAVAELLNETLASLPDIIRGVAENLSAVVEGIVSAIPGIAEALAEAIPEIGRALADGLPAIADALVEAVPEVVSALLESVGPIVAALVEALAELIPQITEAIVAALPALADVLADALAKLSELVPVIVQSLVELLAEGLPEIVGAIFEALPGIVDNLAEGVVALVQGAVRLLSETLPQIIQEILSNLPAIILSILSAVGEIVDAILTEFVPAIPGIVIEIVTAILGNLPEIIIALVTGIVELIPQIAVSLVEMIIRLIPELIAAFLVQLPAIVVALALELVAAIPTIVIELLKSLADRLVEFFKDPLGSLGRFLWSAFIEPFTEVFGRVAEVFKGVGEAFARVGELFMGLWESLTSLWDGVKDFFANVKEFLSNLVDKLTLGASTGDEEKGDRKGIGRVTGFLRDAAEWVGDGVRNVGEAIGNAAESVGDFFRGIFQFGGTVPKAQFGRTIPGDLLPGLANRPVPVLAHAGEAFLQRPAVKFLGGPGGVSALNRGLVPDSMRERINRDRMGPAMPPMVNINGGVIFGREARTVVDDITNRSYRANSGRTARLLHRRYGSMPGQRG